MITKVPGVRERVETGPIQFGDDWPGVFIRGDDASGYLTMLVSGHIPDELLDLLESCRVEQR